MACAKFQIVRKCKVCGDRSPLREDKTPSFVVNNNLHEWYDFGIAEGGDLIELGKRMYNTNDIHTVKRC